MQCYSAPLHSALLYSALLYSALLCSTTLHYTIYAVLYHTPLYYVLLGTTVTTVYYSILKSVHYSLLYYTTLQTHAMSFVGFGWSWRICDHCNQSFNGWGWWKKKKASFFRRPSRTYFLLSCSIYQHNNGAGKSVRPAFGLQIPEWIVPRNPVEDLQTKAVCLHTFLKHYLSDIDQGLGLVALPRPSPHPLSRCSSEHSCNGERSSDAQTCSRGK